MTNETCYLHKGKYISKETGKEVQMDDDIVEDIDNYKDFEEYKKRFHPSIFKESQW
jgi:hypothetical protein